jgi:hypothetical protein
VLDEQEEAPMDSKTDDVEEEIEDETEGPEQVYSEADNNDDDEKKRSEEDKEKKDKGSDSESSSSSSESESSDEEEDGKSSRKDSEKAVSIRGLRLPSVKHDCAILVENLLECCQFDV